MNPYVTPGTYTARLKLKGQVMETQIEVRGDPRVDLPQTAYQSRTDLSLKLRELLSETHTMINDSKTYDTQLKELKKKLDKSESKDFDKSLFEDIKGAHKSISDLQDDILKRPPPNMGYRQRPRLREEIRSLMRAVNSATAEPTQPQISRLEQLRGEVSDAQATLNQIINEQIQKINDKAKDIPQISVGKKNM